MKNIKITTLLITAGFFLSLALALNSCSGKKTNQDQSLLWQISGNGLEKPSWLFGTIHLLCPDDFELKQKVTDALGKSEQLVLELDFDEPGLIASLQKYMYLPDSIKASDYLNDEEYTIVENYFSDSLGMSFMMMKRIKPFFLISFTLFDFLDCAPVSMEEKLTQEARSEGYEVYGLETIEEQVGFIDDISIEMQAKMLLESITEYNEMKTMFDEMILSYTSENINKLNELMQEYMSEEYAEVELGLLIKRNHKWIGSVKKFMHDRPSFIAVGAGHLIGEEGLISLLRKQGYTVEAVH